MEESASHPAVLWDARYRESLQIWSGRVNAALAEVVAPLTPGTALDLGSGEGADVRWLAEHGWRATGVDISAVAVQRAHTAARERGLTAEQAHFIAADIMSWEPEQSFDLVTSSFMHSHGPFDRTGALRKATRLVAPGGHLCVISHATFPPWAKISHDDDHSHAHETTTPESELKLLALSPDDWEIVTAALRARAASGPAGEQAELHDTILLLRRLR